MEKACRAPSGVPDAFRFVCRGAVSSDQRDRVKSAGRKLGIQIVDIWSGVEFEEALRLLRNFCFSVSLKASFSPMPRASCAGSSMTFQTCLTRTPFASWPRCSSGQPSEPPSRLKARYPPFSRRSKIRLARSIQEFGERETERKFADCRRCTPCEMPERGQH